MTSANPAIPVLDGNREPTSAPSPRPETGLEDELVGLVVEEEDRGRLGGEDRASDVDDRLQQLAEGVLAASQHPRRCLPTAVELVVHADPPVFVAVRWSTLFSWYGVSSGCFASTSAVIPATCGAAKLFPVQRSVPPPGQATSTSTPRAKSSTGGSGFAYQTSGSRSSWLPTEMTDENRHG